MHMEYCLKTHTENLINLIDHLGLSNITFFLQVCTDEPLPTLSTNELFAAVFA